MAMATALPGTAPPASAGTAQQPPAMAPTMPQTPPPPSAASMQPAGASGLASLMPMGQEWTRLFVLAVIVFALSHRKSQSKLKASVAALQHDTTRAAAVAVATAVLFHIAVVKMSQ